MKKYSPIFLAITLFLALFAGDALFDLDELSAVPAKKDKKTIAMYEDVFKKSEFVDIYGTKHELRSIKAPIVIINFWASWCRPCLEEFPSLVELRTKYSKDQIAIFGINSDDENQLRSIKKTIKKFKLNFPNIMSDSNSIYESFRITSIPVSLIFYKGKVVNVSNGAKDFVSIENIEKFESLLKTR